MKEHDPAPRRRTLPPGGRPLNRPVWDGLEAGAGDWDVEAADRLIDEAIQSLPDVPVSSNFTAQVMLAVDRETRQPVIAEGPRPARGFNPFKWLRMAGFAGALALVAWAAVDQHLAFQNAHRALQHAQAELDYARSARDAATLHSLAPVPSVELLQDFDAILRLGSVTSDVDFELLAASQP